MKTLTQMLLGRSAEDVAREAIGKRPKPNVAEMEKVASAIVQKREEEFESFSFSFDPDDLEKTASAVERVIGALEHVRPDLELEDILSIEGKRILNGATIRKLDDSPLEKVATSKLTESVKEMIAAKFGRRG